MVGGAGDVNFSHYNEFLLLGKIRSLPPEKIREVEDFVDFLLEKNEDIWLNRAAAKLSENSFAEIWDNPEDAEYDRL